VLDHFTEKLSTIGSIIINYDKRRSCEYLVNATNNDLFLLFYRNTGDLKLLTGTVHTYVHILHIHHLDLIMSRSLASYARYTAIRNYIARSNISL